MMPSKRALIFGNGFYPQTPIITFLFKLFICANWGELKWINMVIHFLRQQVPKVCNRFRKIMIRLFSLCLYPPPPKLWNLSCFWNCSQKTGTKFFWLLFSSLEIRVRFCTVLALSVALHSTPVMCDSCLLLQLLLLLVTFLHCQRLKFQSLSQTNVIDSYGSLLPPGRFFSFFLKKNYLLILERTRREREYVWEHGEDQRERDRLSTGP